MAPRGLLRPSTGLRMHDHDKIIFLQELRDIKLGVQNKWLITGDFNLIARADEKSNNNLNIRMMGRFRCVLEDLELREFQLVGRRFTWASECQNNTSSKLDRVLMTKDWELHFPQYQLVPASTGISDHCPLLLKKMTVKKFRGFRFETF